MGQQIMCENMDLVERRQGIRSHPLVDDHLWLEAGVASSACARCTELVRQDLCAQLTTLNLYGLGGVGCALVDGLLALAVRSKHAMRATGRSVTH
jgi:hypothetical protein